MSKEQIISELEKAVDIYNGRKSLENLKQVMSLDNKLKYFEKWERL